MYARQLSVAVFLLVILPVALLTTTASASMVLQLSTHSSEAGIPAEDLSATLEFSVTGNELTLSVTNQTSEFTIRRVYFNADSTVDNLTLTSTGGDAGSWSLTSNPEQVTGQNTMADGFGVYSFRIARTIGPTNHQNLIQPGETGIFTFDITGFGFSAASFANTLSDDVDGTHFPGLAAVHFVRGTDDASAFGMVVPAPGSAALLLMALIAGVTGRRRKPAT